MLEKFKPNNPITDSEISTINQYFDQELELLKNILIKHQVTCLVGSSGVFDSFVEINHHNKFNAEYDQSILSSDISMNDFNELYTYLIKSTKEERLVMPGLDSMRVDNIVVATIFTKFVVELSKVANIIQSAYSLKEGVAATYKLIN